MFLCREGSGRLVTHWFVGLEFAKSDGIKNVDLTYDIQSFTDLGQLSRLLTNHSAYYTVRYCVCLQCFDAVGWVAGRAKKLSGGVLAWLSVCNEMQTCIWPS